MKTCNKCGLEKDLEYFPKRIDRKGGYGSICKFCLSKYLKIYRENNLKERKEWQIKNHVKISQYGKDNVKRIQSYQKDKDYGIKYYYKNREKLKLKVKEYRRMKYKTDSDFRLKSNLRTRFYLAIKTKNKYKSIIELIGCTIDYLKHHLEKQFTPEMNWNNYGPIWEIDHIIGCCNFNLTNLDEQQKCFHYSNLQPLFKLDNRRKKKKTTYI